MKLNLYFATSNPNKFEEARLITSNYGVKLNFLEFRTLEIQSENIEEIAKNSLTQVLSKHKLPVFVEDSGLFIEALGGFPGPYSSYTYKTVGIRGVLKLMEGVKNRKAFFLSAVAYGSPTVEPVAFTGRVEGTITLKSHGSKGFGFDPIFTPVNTSKTFGEMLSEEKNKYSHRAMALKKLMEYLTVSS